ncbi:MAG: response regulator transcription factor [Cyclobacteriaceae bacterium]
MKILTVEDEVPLLNSIQGYLRKESYDCSGATTYLEGSEQIRIGGYDCVLIDITLPDGNGLRLLEQIKALDKIPNVIIISAKNSIDDKVDGLNLGADDYLTKPFHLSELNARIKAVARRKSANPFKQFTISNLVFDLENNSVSIDNRLLNFTKKEFDILFYLAENKDRVVSKMILMDRLWGDKINHEESFNFLFSHIKNIKRKLVEAEAELSIRTVYGLGYQLIGHKAK